MSDAVRDEAARAPAAQPSSGGAVAASTTTTTTTTTTAPVEEPKTAEDVADAAARAVWHLEALLEAPLWGPVAEAAAPE